MSEVFATGEEIKELYSLVRRCGMDPSVYAQKLKEKKKLNSLNKLSKADIGALIGQFKQYKKNNETPPMKQERTKEGVDGIDEALDKVDARFRKCMKKARDLVIRCTALTEKEKVSLIIEIAKLYFENIQEVKEK